MARKKPRGQASKIPPERQVPGWLWLITGMILGGFIMFLVHLSDQKKAQQVNETPTVADSADTEPTEEESAIEEKVFTPVFEFYESLKKEQVEIPDYAPPSEQDLKPTHEYYLQVASFRRESDAESARARLILLNMDTQIEKTKLQSGSTRYRVIVGPFQNKSKLAKARQTLVSNRFEYLTLKREI